MTVKKKKKKKQRRRLNSEGDSLETVHTGANCAFADSMASLKETTPACNAVKGIFFQAHGIKFLHKNQTL